MSKELSPLEALEKIRKEIAYYSLYKKHLDTIETALKDYEELKKLKLLPYPKVNDEEYRRSVIKRLQALEIIKDKEVNVFIFLHSGDLETYNDMVEDNRKLTQEEYNLLKEVLF